MYYTSRLNLVFKWLFASFVFVAIACPVPLNANKLSLGRTLGNQERHQAKILALNKKVRGSNSSKGGYGNLSVQEARDFVELVGSKVLLLLQKRGLTRDEQERRYRQILTEHFDMNYIGRYILGRYLRRSPPEKVREFIELFTQLTVEQYVDQFSKYKDQTLHLTKREYRKGRVMVISTYIKQPSAKNIDVQWHLHKKPNGRVVIWEMKVEGVGLTETKRNIYASTLKNGGIDALNESLRREIANYNRLGRQIHGPPR